MATVKVDFREFGLTGLKRMGGLVYEEFLPQLSGNKAMKVYSEMSNNDPVVGAMLFAIDMLLRQVSWRIEPASSSSREDKEAAEFVESCRADMSSTWPDMISEILSFLTFGWSWHEIVYKRRKGDLNDPTQRSRFTDGRIGWRKITIRSQESFDQWDFDEEGGVKGLWQWPWPTFDRRYIPVEKSLLFRTTTQKANPEGKSALRNAYRPWFFKKRMEEIEGIGVERDLAGLPIAWVPPQLLSSTASADEVTVREQIKKIVVNIRRDAQEGILMPLAYDENNNPLYKLELLSTGGRRQFDTSSIINRYDQRIAMTTLSDVILLGHEKVGSFALASSKTELFSMALGVWLDSIGEVFNNYAIPRLLSVNDMQVKTLPRLIHGDIETPDLQELGQFIQMLSGSGAELFPDDELENKLRSMAHLPTKKIEAR